MIVLGTDIKKKRLKVKDYFLSGEEFILQENETFGFLKTTGIAFEKLADYYKSEDYISHSDASKTIFDKLYQWIKKYNIAYKFSKLSQQTNQKTLLDYGCGTGDFLKYAKDKGLKVYGVEPNEAALNLAQKKVGTEYVSSRNLKEINQQFDYITLWHVLEHIPDLFEFIEELKSKLNPDGKILIAVPNHLSLDAKFYKNYWAAWDVPRHIWHFSNDSFQKLMYKNNLEIVKIYPLWFDSFYVSLLSEKYKKTKFGFIRAILIGSLSNLSAIFNQNYSSVIYEIRKK